MGEAVAKQLLFTGLILNCTTVKLNVHSFQPYLLSKSFVFPLILNAWKGKKANCQFGSHDHSIFFRMCITYLAFTISTFFTPLVVSYLTAKWSMFLASTLYTTFMITFMFVNSFAFYTTSALMGIAAARKLSFITYWVVRKDLMEVGDSESAYSSAYLNINSAQLNATTGFPTLRPTFPFSALPKVTYSSRFLFPTYGSMNS